LVLDESTKAVISSKSRFNEDSNDSAGAFSQIAYRYTILREKYIDDFINASVESGCRQLLLLGSGYDTRFFRLPSIRKYSVATFEVDLPNTIEEKRTVIEKRLGRIPAGLSLIPVDLRNTDWKGIFQGGFQAAIPTIYVWQGVSYYLPERTVSAVLDTVRGEMIDGSYVVFDSCWPLMLVENDEIPGIRFNIERLKEIGEPYVFGMDPEEMKRWLLGKGFRNVRLSLLNELERVYMKTSTLPTKTWYVVTASG
jgi:methyltransferase (TIGR00027 family)